MVSIKVKKLQSRNLTPILAVILIALVGAYILSRSRAATPVASFEAETATRTSPATTVNDSSASGGAGLLFSANTGGTVTIGAAGDIGVDPGTRDTDVANKIKADASISSVLAMGDLAYPNGTEAQFQFYHETWGAFKSKTYPAVGNHELFDESTAKPYRDYWNSVGVWASTPKPPSVVNFGYGSSSPLYYSFDLGNWHLIAVDTALAPRTSTSTQLNWLKADLAATTKPCTLAFGHHPFVSGSGAGANADIKPIFQALYDANGDIFLAGHEHAYVAFEKINPNNTADSGGVRPWVVGAGGTGADQTPGTANVNRRLYLGENGFLKLELKATSYTWQYINNTGVVRDSGSDTCNAK